MLTHRLLWKNTQYTKMVSFCLIMWMLYIFLQISLETCADDSRLRFKYGTATQVLFMTFSISWCYRCHILEAIYMPPDVTHWGRVTHICVGNLAIIGSDNGLSPGRRQAIIWTNAGILLIWPLGTNFSELSIEIQAFSFKKNHLKMSSAKSQPFCVGLNELI